MFSFKPDPDFSRLMKALLRQGEPDRVPLYELGADVEVMFEVVKHEEWVHPTCLSQVRAVRSRLVRFYYMLGYDYVPVFGPGIFGRNLSATQDTAGLSRGQRMWLDEHHGLISSQKDFDAFAWPSPTVIDYSAFETTGNRLVDGMKLVGVVSGVMENATWLTGYDTLARMLYEDKPLAEALFRKVGETLVSVCDAMARIESVGAVAMGDDMGFKTSTMISPRHLREYVFPWQKKAVAAVHSHGKPFILHSCGNLKAVMDDLIDDVGIDAKHSYEDLILPVAEAKKQYGKRVAILGGVDMDFLCRARPEEVRKYTRRVIEQCAPGGGYCLGTGNTVANFINVENYLTMVDEGRKASGS